MQKKRSFHFQGLKHYFYENFKQVRQVEVSVEREAAHSIKAVIRVYMKGRWVVVKRRGADVNSLVSQGKRAMDSRLRKLRDRNKRGPRSQKVALDFI